MQHKKMDHPSCFAASLHICIQGESIVCMAYFGMISTWIVSLNLDSTAKSKRVKSALHQSLTKATLWHSVAFSSHIMTNQTSQSRFCVAQSHLPTPSHQRFQIIDESQSQATCRSSINWMARITLIWVTMCPNLEQAIILQAFWGQLEGVRTPESGYGSAHMPHD